MRRKDGTYVSGGICLRDGASNNQSPEPNNPKASEGVIDCTRAHEVHVDVLRWRAQQDLKVFARFVALRDCIRTLDDFWTGKAGELDKKDRNCVFGLFFYFGAAHGLKRKFTRNLRPLLRIGRKPSIYGRK